MARSPSDRLSAHQALNHAWLSELHDPVQQLDGMSTMYVHGSLFFFNRNININIARVISNNNKPTENVEPDYSDSTASAQWPTWAQ